MPSQLAYDMQLLLLLLLLYPVRLIMSLEVVANCRNKSAKQFQFVAMQGEARAKSQVEPTRVEFINMQKAGSAQSMSLGFG